MCSPARHRDPGALRSSNAAQIQLPMSLDSPRLDSSERAIDEAVADAEAYTVTTRV